MGPITSRLGAAVGGVALLTAIATAHCADASGQRGNQLACSRGALYICGALIANPRIAPGIRVAIEETIAEIEALLARCTGGDREACANALERYPELPPTQRDAAVRGARP